MPDLTKVPVKIIIVDDNEGYRGFLKDLVAGIEGVDVLADVPSGRAALAKLKQTCADLVLLDIEMPFMDGVQTLERIRRFHQNVSVVMLSAFCGDGTEKVVRALEMGALDFVAKTDSEEKGNIVLSLRSRLTALIGLCRSRRNARIANLVVNEQSISDANRKASNGSVMPPQKTTSTTVQSMYPQSGSSKGTSSNSRIEVVAIGVSTGGPNALSRVIPCLPRDLGVPVLLVQHTLPALIGSLAESLRSKASIPVRVPIDGEEVVPDTIYLAPGNRHMVVASSHAPTPGDASKRIMLLDKPPVNSCRPSVDVLFRSISEVYEGGVLAVIMTGMGSDGMEGVRSLKQKRCYCLSQSEDTCVVYGMPKAVDGAGLSDERVTLDLIAGRIVEIVRGSNRA